MLYTPLMEAGTQSQMEKDEIMAVYLLILRYGPASIIKCVHGICIAEAIEENPQPLLEYVNALQKHEKEVFRMLREAGKAGKEHESVSDAYTVVGKGGVKRKLKMDDLGDVGTSKGVVSTGW